MDGWVAFGGGSPSPSPSVQSKDDDDVLPPPPVGPLPFAPPFRLHVLSQPFSQTWPHIPRCRPRPCALSEFCSEMGAACRDGRRRTVQRRAYGMIRPSMYGNPCHACCKCCLNAQRVEHPRRLTAASLFAWRWAEGDRVVHRSPGPVSSRSRNKAPRQRRGRHPRQEELSSHCFLDSPWRRQRGNLWGRNRSGANQRHSSSLVLAAMALFPRFSQSSTVNPCCRHMCLCR